MIFSDRLKNLMKAASCTQVQLAAALSVSQGSVFKWLNGSVPQGDKLFALATYFHVEPTWLLSGEGPRDNRLEHYINLLQENPAEFHAETESSQLVSLTADLNFERARADMAIKLLQKQKLEIEELLAQISKKAQ